MPGTNALDLASATVGCAACQEALWCIVSARQARKSEGELADAPAAEQFVIGTGAMLAGAAGAVAIA